MTDIDLNQFVVDQRIEVAHERYARQLRSAIRQSGNPIKAYKEAMEILGIDVLETSFGELIVFSPDLNHSPE